MSETPDQPANANASASIHELVARQENLALAIAQAELPVLQELQQFLASPEVRGVVDRLTEFSGRLSQTSGAGINNVQVTVNMLGTQVGSMIHQHQIRINQNQSTGGNNVQQ